MSYSMSPQQGSAPPYSPPYPGSATSPSNPSPFAQPPAKRQRLSPDPRSPHNGVSSYPALSQTQQGMPNQAGYHNQHAPAPNAQSPYSPSTFPGSPQGSFNTPQPYPHQQTSWQSQHGSPTLTAGPTTLGQNSPPSQQSREMMPPPPRPNKDDKEEKVGVEEIGDSLYGSGINLKDEENYIQSMYNNRHASESFSTTQNSSFGSNTLSPNNSFNALTQGTSVSGSQGTHGALAGTFGPTQSQDDIELDQRRRRETAAKSRADRMQHHLNNQFLLCNNVRKRMDNVARSNGVMLNVTGLYVRQPETNVMVNGTGKEGVVAVGEKGNGVRTEDRPESMVSQGAAFEHLLALLSLAAEERVRGLVDDAYALARSRRYGDHGAVVPPEFAGIAEGQGKHDEAAIVPENITGTQWGKVTDSQAAGQELRDSSTDKKPSPPQQTMAFEGNLNSHLLRVAERERQAEKARTKKRQARKQATDSSANGESASVDAPTETNTSAGPAEAAAPVKLSKKEQLKQQKERNSIDAMTHSSTNQTAAMMALGRKGNRYSWMSGGAANLPTNRFAKPTSASASGTSTPSAIKQEAQSPASGEVAVGRTGNVVSAEPKASEWGDWREDMAGGKGVQIRDWVFVLEKDGREKLALQKALLKLH